MNDVLGAVNDFILAFVKNNEVTALPQKNIIIGWQNVVSALPKKSQEYAVLTLLSTIRHGTNIHNYQHAEGDTGLVNTVGRMAEHIVQVDFCSARPQQGEEVARTRAEIMEMLHRDSTATEFYKTYGFSSCYAEDVRPMPFQNESEQWVARYIVTLHLSGWTATNIDQRSFESVGLYLENTDVHHPATDDPEKQDREYTVEHISNANSGYIHEIIEPVVDEDTEQET